MTAASSRATGICASRVGRFVAAGALVVIALGCKKSAKTSGSTAASAPPNFICSQPGWCKLPISNAPIVGSHYVSVWTGQEMLFWGGGDYSSQTLDNGYLLNPATGTWTEMKQTGKRPTPRDDASVVWTGSELLLWGGATASQELNDGYRWSPKSGEWTAMVQTGAVPSARQRHSAIWTGSEMVIWGGSWTSTKPEDPAELNDGYRWNPKSGEWTAMVQIGAVPDRRALHSAVWTGSEMIIWGGFSTSQVFSDGARWNPASGEWTLMEQKGALLSPRSSQSAVWTGAELVVWGGMHVHGDYSEAAGMDSGGRWNPKSGEWTAIPPSETSPTKRFSHNAIWNGSEMILRGGENGTGQLSDGYAWRP